MSGVAAAEQVFEPVMVGPFRLSYELVDRKKLADSGVKVPVQVAYSNAWVLRRHEDGKRWRFVRAFLSEPQAREWAAAQPQA
ncbi:MAG: hypothetical protein EYC70_01665 [Planctomycetota bacterium]|nr:MAG: hypothetical protein EYC70_01665 [Planctomycetota bacterium]